MSASTIMAVWFLPAEACTTFHGFLRSAGRGEAVRVCRVWISQGDGRRQTL